MSTYETGKPGSCNGLFGTRIGAPGEGMKILRSSNKKNRRIYK